MNLQTSSTDLAQQIYEAMSLGSLAAQGALGALAGVLLGLVAAWLLQRYGLLARRHRAHHLALKLYFLALPAALGFLGFHAGLLRGIERQAYVQLQTHRQELKAYADSALAGFQQSLASQNFGELKLESTSLKDMLRTLIEHYVASQIPERAQAEASWLERQGVALLNGVQVQLITEVVARQLSDKAVQSTGLDKNSVQALAKAPLAQWFDVDFLLDLVKREISARLGGFYKALALAGLLLAAAVAAEIGLSRWRGWHRATSAPVAVPAAMNSSAAINPPV